MEEEGVGTKYLLQDERYFTTLAFVDIDEKGERQFSFSRKASADTQLCASELDRKLLENCKMYGNATAALCVQKRGGIPAIPKKEEIEKFVITY